MKKTRRQLAGKRGLGGKLSMLTCYDCPTARVLDEAGVDILLVGDSVGTNVLGYESEREVTTADICHHVSAVRRGTTRAYVLADMPYRTYESPEDGLKTARRLLDAGADGVKLEGRREDVIAALTGSGVEVCAHLGLNPQVHDTVRLQARTAAAAAELVEDARAVAAAGAWIVVLELIPEEVGRLVTRSVAIPTIGIAAGADTDGQVLVVHDLLGWNTVSLRHVRAYAGLRDRTLEAAAAYVEDVRAGRFPGAAQVRRLPPDVAAAIDAIVGAAE